MLADYTKAIQEKLDNEWYWLDRIIDELINIAFYAKKQTQDGDNIPDYDIRLKWLRVLLEIAWYSNSKKKNEKPNLNINFLLKE